MPLFLRVMIFIQRSTWEKVWKRVCGFYLRLWKGTDEISNPFFPESFFNKRQISISHKTYIIYFCNYKTFKQRPYQILSLSRKNEMANIGLTFKRKHLAKAKKSPRFFLALEEPLGFFSLHHMPSFYFKSNFKGFVFSAEWQNLRAFVMST